MCSNRKAGRLTNFTRPGRKLSPAVFELVKRYQGSISAEHGVGLLKRDDLAWSRSAEEIEFMTRIKAAFDPDGIMNPGKLLVASQGS